MRKTAITLEIEMGGACSLHGKKRKAYKFVVTQKEKDNLEDLVVNGLCVGLITSSEESYRMWCFIACDLETSRMRGHDSR
jgi:hypothetical protein